MYDFDEKYAQTYTKECECGRKIEVSTKRDQHSAYYTHVYVRCECGKSVCVILPLG